MKANMKKMIALGLSVVLVLGSLTGCGESGDNKAASGSGSTEKTTESQKTTFDDLGGMSVTVGDWYTSWDDLQNRTTEFGKAQNKYWKEIQEKYNFKIKRDNMFSYGEAQTSYVNEVMANNPNCQLYYLYQEFVSEPLMNSLMYDLSSLPEFDFSEEKWNPTVKDLMSIGNGLFGMSVENEPRGGIFFNKRLFKEAGIPEDEPYDLQANGQWTWDKFEDYCKKLTKDTDGDGKTDQYAMASFSKYYLPMCAATNNATFVTRAEDGSYENAINSSEFKDAMNWGVGLIKKGYIKPKPSEDIAWDWYKAAFRDGEAAMQTAEVYEISAFADMDDDWGFIMFPYNQDNKDATNKWIPNDNIVVMPSCFDKDTAEKIAFAYDLFTEPIEGFTIEEGRIADYYAKFRDERAVDETIMTMLQQEHIQTSYLPMISDLDYGDFCYPVYAGATTPQKQIEKLNSKWDSKIKTVNEKYKKFADKNSK